MSKVAGGTGPSADHDSNDKKGGYLVAQNFSAYNSKVQLHSPYFASAGPNCRLTFSFFLNEPKHLDSISLYLKSNTHPPRVTKVWSYNAKLSYAQMWNEETARVGKQANGFNLFFEAVQGLKGSKADLALDDFRFTNCHQNETQTELVCAENEYRCDDNLQCIDYWRLCDGMHLRKKFEFTLNQT